MTASKMILFGCLFFTMPAMIGMSQTNERSKKEKIKSVINIQEAIKNNLLKEYNLNIDTLTELQNKAAKRIIVVEKPVIRYVRVYKTVPVYVPADDSTKYLNAFPRDTLKDIYLSQYDSIPRHKSFIRKIFPKQKK